MNDQFQFYLNESNQEVKQSFVKLADIIEFKRFSTLLDVGCATGAFPSYVSQRFPNSKVTGIDNNEDFIKKALEDFPDISFQIGDVFDRNSIKTEFDVVTMLGVLGIFDDYSRVLSNALSWVKPKGRLVIHNMVSQYDIDVFIKYKPSSHQSENAEFKTGWNIISQKSLEMVALQNGAKLIYSEPFRLEVNLSQQKDVMRSWTEVNSEGSNDLFNALHVRQPQRIVVIEKDQKF